MYMTKHRVFIAHDFVLEDLLEQIAVQLQAKGLDVIRGPVTTPGEKLVYQPELYSELFENTDVAMFSSRSICSREIMLAAHRLQGIVNPSIGVETVDMDAAGEFGIIVGHGAVPENFTSMAEAVVMLALMLLYNPHRSEAVLRGLQVRPKEPQAQMLLGRTVGLVGFGRIARGVSERLANFGIKLIAYDPYVDPKTVPDHVQLVELETVLRSSDIIALLLTATPETRGMIDGNALSLMKSTTYLINISRGEVLDENALYYALKEKQIAGAAVDTFITEPLPADSPLRTLANVILTPHMVGHTKEMLAALPQAAVENITRILHGEPPLYCANPKVIPAWRKRFGKLNH